MTNADCYLLALLLAGGGVFLVAALWVFDEMRRLKVECGRIAYMLLHDRNNRDFVLEHFRNGQERCDRNWKESGRWMAVVGDRLYPRPIPPKIETNGGGSRRATVK